jgi:hypothetical protein
MYTFSRTDKNAQLDNRMCTHHQHEVKAISRRFPSKTNKFTTTNMHPANETRTQASIQEHTQTHTHTHTHTHTAILIHTTTYQTSGKRWTRLANRTVSTGQTGCALKHNTQHKAQMQLSANRGRRANQVLDYTRVRQMPAYRTIGQRRTRLTSRPVLTRRTRSALKSKNLQGQ